MSAVSRCHRHRFVTLVKSHLVPTRFTQANNMSDPSHSDPLMSDPVYRRMHEEYHRTYTVPEFPSHCPECKAKVKLYHTNTDNSAMFMCSDFDVSLEQCWRLHDIKEFLFVFSALGPWPP